MAMMIVGAGGGGIDIDGAMDWMGLFSLQRRYGWVRVHDFMMMLMTSMP